MHEKHIKTLAGSTAFIGLVVLMLYVYFSEPLDYSSLDYMTGNSLNREAKYSNSQNNCKSHENELDDSDIVISGTIINVNPRNSFSKISIETKKIVEVILFNTNLETNLERYKGKRVTIEGKVSGNEIIANKILLAS